MPSNTTDVEFIVDPKASFIPWWINLQLFAHKLIKWLPGGCADWFFDNIMTWSYFFHRRYSMSRQKSSILITEHALNREPVPLIAASSHSNLCVKSVKHYFTEINSCNTTAGKIFFSIQKQNTTTQPVSRALFLRIKCFHSRCQHLCKLLEQKKAFA